MTLSTIPEVITWPVAAVIIAVLVLPVLLSVVATINSNIGKAVEGVRNLSKASDAIAKMPEYLEKLRETSAEIRELSIQVRGIQETTRSIERRTETIIDNSLKARLESEWSALFDTLAAKAPHVAVDRRTVTNLLEALLSAGAIDQSLAARIEAAFSEVKSVRRYWSSDPRAAERQATAALAEIENLATALT